MLDANPNLTVAQVRQIIQSTAVDWGPAGQDVDYGWGRLDTYAAVRAAGSFAKNTPPAVPGHTFFSGTLAATGAQGQHTFNVTDTTYPVNVTLIMPNWTNSTTPDFDLFVYNPDGTEFGRATGTSRQEQVTGAPTKTGTFKIVVKSYTGSGDYFVDVSAGIAAQTNRPPTVAIAQPPDGAVVTGTVAVKVTAADDQQVTKVEVAVDAGAYTDITGSFDGTYYNFAWDTTALANGTHQLNARATDNTGLQAGATRSVDVENKPSPPPAAHEVTRSGQVTAAAKDSYQTISVLSPGYLDLRLDWSTTADLDFYVYAPDGTYVARAYTLNKPETLRVDTTRWGTGTYTVRVNLFAGPDTVFTLTADGYRKDTYTGAVATAQPNFTQTRTLGYTGRGLVTLAWPGSPDLDFYVYDPTGKLKGQAFTLNNPEQATITFDSTGIWSVKVVLYSGPGATFTLSIYAPEAVLN
jgi:hypothetical protein